MPPRSRSPRRLADRSRRRALDVPARRHRAATLKQNAEARADFEAALKLDEVYLPIRYRLSDTLVDLGDIDGARKALERTTREHPDQAVAFAMLGQISMRQKRYTDAIENLQRR